MEKGKLISARASAILAMETAAKPENFNQADFDKAKKEVDSYTAQK
ncbi:hypothetical protein N3114_11280 [Aliarcobacter butzleri]|nr:hypothetical protein [Aliarcobacter butzleri]UXC29221.1 hypothetical protein N3114_11280 [Aliarcobacter butzleri]